LRGLLADPGVREAVRAHAAVTRAAHLRQLGGHAAARRWDGLGLVLATRTGQREPAGGAPAAAREARPGVPGAAAGALSDAAGPPGDAAAREALLGPPGAAGAPPGDAAGAAGCGMDRAAARTDALVGLAADALGLGSLPLAERLLRAAGPSVDAHPSWRPAVRWHWVRAELALCRDQAAEAARHARLAVDAAVAAGAVRHEVKSRVVLAVAEAGSGHPLSQVVDTLGDLSERTRRTGLVTLEWPIALLTGDLTAATKPDEAAAHRREAQRLVGAIRLLTDPDGRYVLDRSPWVPPAVNS
jgi:hypothetical protein